MGLHIYIYKDDLGDCTNGGASARDGVKGFCITNISAPFSPSTEYPSAELVLQENIFGKTVKIVPTEIGKRHSMFGGNYGATSDSRFSDMVEDMLGHSFYGAVPIHDRVE
tara:strand:- start:582 stop:911 length:330 start_codon:yes stop_codon:yes gene_type:complete